MSAAFDLFFCSATGNAPYDYQARLAGGDDGVCCESQLISIPTGLGKRETLRRLKQLLRVARTGRKKA